jgi:hypothetical protein
MFFGNVRCMIQKWLSFDSTFINRRETRSGIRSEIKY